MGTIPISIATQPLHPPDEDVRAPDPAMSPEVDASCKWPVLGLFVGASFWLLVGLVFALISAIKMHAPGVFADTPWLTYGRIRPAYLNCILYGFASQSILAILLWLSCRLGRVPLANPCVAYAGAKLWNLGVFVGILQILAGGTTGFQWLEIPREAAVILFAGYSIVALCALRAFIERREPNLYISQWYVLAALFFFPWIYSCAYLLLVFHPVRGVLQPIVDTWFTQSLSDLWLAPGGIAVLYYLLPSLSGRPVYSYYLAVFGFWSLLITAPWGGWAQLAGGPVPSWVVGLGVSSKFLIIMPVMAVAINWYLTLDRLPSQPKQSVAWKFLRFGAICYVLAAILDLLSKLPAISPILQFAGFSLALVHLTLFGFVGMVASGAMVHVVPRLLQTEWHSPKLIQIHYRLFSAGIVLFVAAFAVGGIVHGARMNNPAIDFSTAVRATVPFIGLSTLGLLMMFLGQLALLSNLCHMLRHAIRPYRLMAAEWIGGTQSVKKEGWAK